MRASFLSPHWVLAVAAFCCAPLFASLKSLPPRTVVNLDGQWQVEEGPMHSPPEVFSHTVAVPGLIDMAQPAFREVGRQSALREAFWYRRVFTVPGRVPASAVLKMHKARYGTKVFMSGRLVGEHLPCFTPAYFDVKEHLKGDGQSNELTVRVGAGRESLPAGMPTGWDFEKYLYIPGIYDSVELVLTGAPRIVNVQTVPDIAAKSVRVVAEVEGAESAADATLKAQIVEAASGKEVGAKTALPLRLNAGATQTVDFSIPMESCRLWSPEDPFLYELRLSTGADAVRVRFGMRSFRFDPQSKRALLNGRPYFMRGSNVTAYRFFEDAERGDRPWRVEWVRRLHRKFKTMHWNSLRYCIGFPPEMWYEVADEEGFLIQDEFPIWLLGEAPEHPQAEKIIPEYTEWMRERWNHPCVVIWDAQNESHTDQTGKALQAVRHLDLSNRPWENGWAEPQGPADCVEAHPYLFIRTWMGEKPFRFEEIGRTSSVPPLQPAQRKLNVPIIINEYGWLWLTRDGNPTCLTDAVYKSLLGPDSTVEQRRRLYARYLAAKTEFWRCHREVAGVLHFCGLGYSRPGDKPRPEGGATSDHFTDLERLAFEPLFEEYVGEAFNPLGMMLDFWEQELAPGQGRTLNVFVINDLYEDWQGEVRLWIGSSEKTLSSHSRTVKVAGLGREILTFAATAPEAPGEYTITAELTDSVGKRVRSLRDFRVTAVK